LKLSLIAALSQNRVIGSNGKLPWYLPEDLKYFKKVTMGKPIIMGHATYKSVGKPLPGRLNIIISRNTDLSIPGCEVVADLQRAVNCAQANCLEGDKDEAFVVGGAQIYEMAIDQVERMYLTEIHASLDGDTYFPNFDRGDWHETTRRDVAAVPPNKHDYSFVVLERRVPSSQ